MSQDYDELIDRNEAELRIVIERMELARSRIVLAVGVYLKDEYPRIARRQISEDIDVFRELSDKRIQSLRDKVRELEGRAEEIAAEEFASEDLWWHIHPRRQDRLARSVGEDNQTFGPPLRYCLGRLGGILVKAGYLTHPASDHSTSHTWTAPVGPEGPDSVSRFYYPGEYKLDWPEYLEGPIREYSELITAGEKLWVEVSELKRRRDIEAAGRKWDALS